MAMDYDPNKVTTEPQRRALEEMSHELVEKLNRMVAEQEERAALFAAQQHSLSSKPAVPTSVPKPTYNYPTPPPLVTQTRQAAVSRTPAPEPQQSRIKAAKETYLPPVPPSPVSGKKKHPTVIAPKKKEEEGMGTGFIILILIVLFLLARACS